MYAFALEASLELIMKVLQENGEAFLLVFWFGVITRFIFPFNFSFFILFSFFCCFFWGIGGI